LLTIWIIVAVFGGGALLYLLLDRTLSAPRYHGPAADHFDGRRFRNQEPPKRKGFFDFLRWQLTSRRGEWSDWTDSEPGGSPPERVNGNQLRVTFINHATVLIQTESLNLLTDPIWSERASPIKWVGPKRHRLPGLRFEDLPPIDVVLISHNHYDHLDVQTITRLRNQHNPHFVTGLGTSALLRRYGVSDVMEMDWWNTEKVSDHVDISCVPAKHFSGRGLTDADRTLWCGYVVQTSTGNIYFAGDTGMGNHFKQIKERFKRFRLMLLPIGAYLPGWFMHPVHISPTEAVEIHHMFQPNVSVAIHFGTFALGDDGEVEPVLKLREALQNAENTANFWVLDHGEGRDVP
jgi:L-ascorbate metabolism protein UlaG (beta-lactamase superfamily)